MKNYIVFFLAVFLLSQQVSAVNAAERAAAQPSPTDIQPIRPTTTTVIVVRHAEKDENWPVSKDKTCPLTKKGEERAETLKYIADILGVSVVYSTDTTRTKETVNNYADWKKIPINLYNSDDQLVADIKKNHKGKVVLVAGHSETVPYFIKKLGISSDVPVANYNDIFIVTITSSPLLPMASPSLLPMASPSLLPMTYDLMRH